MMVIAAAISFSLPFFPAAVAAGIAVAVGAAALPGAVAAAAAEAGVEPGVAAVAAVAAEAAAASAAAAAVEPEAGPGVAPGVAGAAAVGPEVVAAGLLEAGAAAEVQAAAAPGPVPGAAGAAPAWAAPGVAGAPGAEAGVGPAARAAAAPGVLPERCRRFYLGFSPGWSLGLNLRRPLRLRLGLACGAAALGPLAFSFRLPPPLRRQAPGAGGNGRRTGLCRPRSNRGGWRPRPDPRVEFSRFSPTGWRSNGLYLPRSGRDPGLHPGWLSRCAWLNLPRFGLGSVELPRLCRNARLHLSRPGRSSRLDLARSRLGRGCRGKRPGFARHKLLLGGQLLNLLGSSGGSAAWWPGGVTPCPAGPVPVAALRAGPGE